MRSTWHLYPSFESGFVAPAVERGDSGDRCARSHICLTNRTILAIRYKSHFGGERPPRERERPKGSHAQGAVRGYGLALRPAEIPGVLESFWRRAPNSILHTADARGNYSVSFPLGIIDCGYSGRGNPTRRASIGRSIIGFTFGRPLFSSTTTRPLHVWPEDAPSNLGLVEIMAGRTERFGRLASAAHRLFPCSIRVARSRGRLGVTHCKTTARVAASCRPSGTHLGQ